MSQHLRRTLHVRCPVSQAFAAFTEQIDLWWPRGHRRFPQSRLRLEARVGGRFYERAHTGEEVRLGEVLVCDPPNRILYSWYPGASDSPTEVDVRFTEDGDLTCVEVTHSEGASGLGDAWPDRAVLFERGWNSVLPAFAGFAASSDVAPGRVRGPQGRKTPPEKQIR